MPLQERLQTDYLSLQTFASINSNHLELTYRAPDLRRFSVRARLQAPIASGDGFVIAGDHTLVIEIPDNYLHRDANGLFVKSRIRREGERVYHPNVWPSDGYFCYDDQFHPAKSLAEQLWSATELMQCRAVNHESPANWEADFFYLKNTDTIRELVDSVPLRLQRGGVRVAAISSPRLV